MRNLWVFTACLVLSLTMQGVAFLQTCDDPEHPRTGDVNGDGRLSADDAQLALSLVVYGASGNPDIDCPADCNGDGEITSEDVQSIFYSAIEKDECVDPIAS